MSKEAVKEFFDYAFSKYEFPTHLYVNIINDLKYIYENFFSELTKPEFIDKFIHDLLKYKTNIFQSEIGKYFFANIEDKSSITILALSVQFNIHKKKILKTLRNNFK